MIADGNGYHAEGGEAVARRNCTCITATALANRAAPLGGWPARGVGLAVHLGANLGLVPAKVLVFEGGLKPANAAPYGSKAPSV